MDRMSYQIQPYTYQQAKKLGVQVKPSTVKGKKIDVFKKGEKVASVGAKGYKDYPTYMKIDPELAKERRRLYKDRHESDRKKVGSAGFYADRLLW